MVGHSPNVESTVLKASLKDKTVNGTDASCWWDIFIPTTTTYTEQIHRIERRRLAQRGLVQGRGTLTHCLTTESESNDERDKV